MGSNRTIPESSSSLLRVFLAFVAMLCVSFCAEKGEDNCLDIYRRFSNNHTACLPPNKNCEILKSGVSDKDRQLILDVHNKLRNKIATGGEKEAFEFGPASNMMEMEWDDELEKIAQAHASQCTFDHDCNRCRQSTNFAAGQNLWLYTSTRTTPGKTKWEEAIRNWYEEIELVNNKGIVKSFELDPETAHFTQVVWAETWKIGCGFAVYKIEDGEYNTEELYTCNYGPRGNNFFEKIYDEGEACGKCPSNTCCGADACKAENVTAKYKGLCKSLTPNGPRQRSPSGKDAIFECDFDSSDDMNKDCDVTIKGEEWTTVETITGNYKSALLNGSQQTEMTFNRRFKPDSKSFCFLMKYRKGPNVAGAKGSNTFQVFLIFPKRRGSRLQIDYNGDSTDWLKVKWHGQQWTEETEITLHFSVPKDSSPQYIDIDDVMVLDGKCP